MPLNKPYARIADLPLVAPVFPLQGVLLLPRGELPLNIFEPRYVAMIEDAMRGDRLIGMIQPAPRADERAARPDLEGIGCLGRITQMAETGDGRYVLNLTGVIRFRVLDELQAMTPYRQCRLGLDEFERDLSPDKGADGIDRTKLIQAFRKFAKARDIKVDWSNINAAPTEPLITALAMMSPFGPSEKQALLEARDIQARADALIAIADRDISNNGSAPETLH